jgi:TonB family protein
MGNGTAFRATASGLARLLLACVIATVAAAPAHADLRGAYGDYKKGDFAHAFQEFLALAEIGQPQAQFVVAEMYHDGQGTPQSDIHAYAWATLAATNGMVAGKALADEIRPKLAPGSARIAGWVTRSYTESALEGTLLPDLLTVPRQAPRVSPSKLVPGYPLKVVRAYLAPYPTDARRQGIQGWVFAEFTVMRDGRPRFPRIIYANPTGVFDDTAKESVLGSQFVLAGSTPLRTSIPYHFTLTRPQGPYHITSGDADGQQPGIPAQLITDAKAGDPESELLYGLLQDPGFGSAGGLPWLVKAGQAGLGAAQYEIGRDLLGGMGCRPDEAKAVRWLSMAADQGDPNAEIALARRLLHGAPSAADVTRAKALLERTAGPGTEESSQDTQLLLAAILAATPQSALRDPQRAMELLSKIDDADGDPTPLEIRAAAQAAQGHFHHAVKNERRAIRSARLLKWDLAPLQARLATYRAAKPWYGDLLDF